MPRHKFHPTDEQRTLVKTLSAVGIPQEDIARKLGVRSPKTIRKYFRDELDLGLTDANATVGASLFRQALKGNVDAQKFWLAHRGGAAWNRSPVKQAQAPPPFLVACEGGAAQEQNASEKRGLTSEEAVSVKADAAFDEEKEAA